MEIGEFVLDVRVELVLKGASATSSYMTDGYIGPCTVGVHHIVFIPLCWTLDMFPVFSLSTGVAGNPLCTRALGHVPGDGITGWK